MKSDIRFVIFSFVLLICGSVFCTGKSAAAKMYGGKCGENVYWSYDSKADVLVVSGTGAMTSAPWRDETELCESFYSKVIIEEGVTSVVEEAFQYEGIGEAIIGSDVTDIGDYAFAGNTMEKVQLPGSVKKIGKGVFSEGYLKSIDLQNVEEIGPRAFAECESLEKVTFGENLTKIEKGAFADCESLKKISFGEKLEKLAKGAFAGCLSLTEVEFRGGAPQVDKASFRNSRFLKRIINHSTARIPLGKLDPDLFWYQDGKKVTSVSPGKTARSKGRLFRVTYKDLQGKLYGKLPKTYRYAENKYLPTRGKRKGYLFYGWSSGEYWLSDLCDIRGDWTLLPIWIRYDITRVSSSKRKFSFDINRKYEYFNSRYIQIRYSENKNMKKARYARSWDYWKGEIMLKGLKKGKKYYVQLRSVEDDSKSPWSNTFVIRN